MSPHPSCCKSKYEYWKLISPLCLVTQWTPAPLRWILHFGIWFRRTIRSLWLLIPLDTALVPYISFIFVYLSSQTCHCFVIRIFWQLLASYLTSHRELCCEATSVLELGAGAGLAGLVAATLSADPSSCALTDNNEKILEILERNVCSNFTDEKRESYMIGCCRNEY